MLVLSRKLYETVVIDGVITISVVRIEPKVIRLAIKAPDRIMIMRGELVAPTALADVVEPIRDRPDRSGSGPGWLVLSRKLNETIVIDGEIEVTVVRIEPKVIRLAIKAPDQVKIMRGELVNRIRLAKSVAPLRKRPSSPARCGLDADPVGCDAQEVS